MKVEIDPGAGFCFGVAKAISIAEQELAQCGSLISLGDLVHNTAEMNRLEIKGISVVSHGDLSKHTGKRILVRAHGEPPLTYATAGQLGIELIDATCPIVVKLQQNIKRTFEQGTAQIVIFGKHGHPEMIGLTGHTQNTAIIVNSEADLGNLDFGKPVRLFCQTTMSEEEYNAMANLISERMQETGNTDLVVNKSVCRQVSGRAAGLRKFVSSHDVIIFASDSKSSNGKYLFGICKAENSKSYFVHDEASLQKEWFQGAASVGITGATSTPLWLMEAIQTKIPELFTSEKQAK